MAVTAAYRAPDPPERNNFGPGRDLRLQLPKTYEFGKTWQWTVFVAIEPGKRIQYSFNFAANHENEVLLYEYPDWQLIRLRRINNYFMELPGGAWTFENDSESVAYHVLTGWHKNHPPGSGPWWQSPVTIRDSSGTQLKVTFVDTWSEDNENAIVTIYLDDSDDCELYYHQSFPG